jgi:hypothetical protein
MIKSILLITLLVLPNVLNADPTLICEYGGTMVLTVPRSDYQEEPNSILKIVVWNGQTMGKGRPPDTCVISDIAIITYDHTLNEETIDGELVTYPDNFDFVTVAPFDMYTIENQNREIEENTRQEFYVYEKLLG